MADRNSVPPPSGVGRSMRGRPAVKPRDMKGTLRRLWELTKGHRGGLKWLMGLSGLASASSILSPLVIGRAVTAVDQGDPVRALLFALLMLYLGDWLVRFLQQYFMASIGQRMICYIRVSLFNVMKKLPLSFFDRRRHGELMSRLTNDVDNISTTLSNSLTQLMTYAFTIAGIFGVMLWLSPLLTAVSLAGVLLIFLLTRFVTKRTHRLFADQQRLLGRLNGQIEESISGLNVVKAFCREERMVAEFEENNAALCGVATRALIWSGFLMPLTNVVNNLSFVAVSVVSGLMAVHGLITVGMISSFLLYTRQFSRPFVDIANIYNNFQTAVAGAERLFEILDESPEPQDGPDALPLTAPKGSFELQNVGFAYVEGFPILNDLTLSVPAGTKTAVVGPTGAGKTTIINLLTRFYDVTGGRILLDGHDLRDYRMADLRRSFGVVLQDTALFAETVAENIRYGREDATRAEIEAAARVAGADAFIRRLGDGYDTVLTQGGEELSQGERQLLTIARAVLANAPILILDEATSQLDAVTEQRLMQSLEPFMAGRTTLIVSHRRAGLEGVDQIISLDRGGAI